MIEDGPDGRLPQTAMRDLLRQLTREANAYEPVRPPPPAEQALRAAHSDTHSTLTVGDWVLRQDPDTGDLIADNGDGSSTVLARKE